MDHVSQSVRRTKLLSNETLDVPNLNDGAIESYALLIERVLELEMNPRRHATWNYGAACVLDGRIHRASTVCTSADGGRDVSGPERNKKKN